MRTVESILFQAESAFKAADTLMREGYTVRCYGSYYRCKEWGFSGSGDSYTYSVFPSNNA